MARVFLGQSQSEVRHVQWNIRLLSKLIVHKKPNNLRSSCLLLCTLYMPEMKPLFGHLKLRRSSWLFTNPVQEHTWAAEFDSQLKAQIRSSMQFLWMLWMRRIDLPVAKKELVIRVTIQQDTSPLSIEEKEFLLLRWDMYTSFEFAFFLLLFSPELIRYTTYLLDS